MSPISTVPSQADGPVVDSKVHSSNSSLPPLSTRSRRLSHGQDSRRNDLWGGQGARADRFPSWGAGASPSSRNVWGSPDNDRGLGNGTFNPDLGRVTNASSAASQGPKGPLPIAPPSNTARVPPHSQPQASQMPSISSQNPRYGPPGPDLGSKWVTSVAENDKKLSATRLTERAGRERQLMERGLTMADTQPTIKETWRPIHVPGDGTRHNIGTADVQSHQSAPWKATKDESQKGTTSLEDSAPSANAGIIGSGALSQSRPSRFFPAKDIRHETLSGRSFSRPSSPTPPPPTMEGHPAYEGDVMRPHVSLPKPQPVVKLPPTMCSTQHPPSRSSNVWSTRISPKDGQREEPSLVIYHRATSITGKPDSINCSMETNRPKAEIPLLTSLAKAHSITLAIKPLPLFLSLAYPQHKLMLVLNYLYLSLWQKSVSRSKRWALCLKYASLIRYQTQHGSLLWLKRRRCLRNSLFRRPSWNRFVLQTSMGARVLSIFIFRE